MNAWGDLEGWMPGELLAIGQPALVHDPSEPWRLRRLDRVVGFLAAMRVDPSIVALEDHRGELLVTPRRVLTSREQAVVYAAWESVVGDGSDNVTFREPSGAAA